jgi:hypothetical protein
LEDQYDMKNSVQYWRLPVVLCALGVTGSSEVIHSGESIFVINVKGGRGVAFHGSYLAVTGTGESKNTKVEGTVPAEFRVVATSVYLSLQNHSPGQDGRDIEIRVNSAGKPELDKESARANEGQYLEVAISKNGATIKEQRTDAPYGVVSLGTEELSGGPPIQTEYRVDGSVKFAMLTLTSERGDIEQELVPLPFTKGFFPKEGWAVGLTAQKIRVTRLDPLSAAPSIEVLDGGRNGSLHVAIVVNGTTLEEATTSEAFGVASATVRIP